MSIIAIAAIGENRELGKGGELIWKIRPDLLHFHQLTEWHPVIMGRRTWESLPDIHRPLENRTSFVVSRDPNYRANGAIVCPSFETALVQARHAAGSEEIYVIGGEKIYEAALPFATKLELTLIEATDADADTVFPPYEDTFVEERRDGPHRDVKSGIMFSYVTFKRK